MAYRFLPLLDIALVEPQVIETGRTGDVTLEKAVAALQFPAQLRVIAPERSNGHTDAFIKPLGKDYPASTAYPQVTICQLHFLRLPCGQIAHEEHIGFRPAKGHTIGRQTRQSSRGNS